MWVLGCLCIRPTQRWSPSTQCLPPYFPRGWQNQGTVPGSAPCGKGLQPPKLCPDKLSFFIKLAALKHSVVITTERNNQGVQLWFPRYRGTGAEWQAGLWLLLAQRSSERALAGVVGLRAQASGGGRYMTEGTARPAGRSACRGQNSRKHQSGAEGLEPEGPWCWAGEATQRHWDAQVCARGSGPQSCPSPQPARGPRWPLLPSSFELGATEPSASYLTAPPAARTPEPRTGAFWGFPLPCPLRALGGASLNWMRALNSEVRRTPGQRLTTASFASPPGVPPVLPESP